MKKKRKNDIIHKKGVRQYGGILNEIYEERFLNCSYGFRPGRNAHMAVREINQNMMIHKVNYVLEAEIKGFFDVRP